MGIHALIAIRVAAIMLPVDVMRFQAIRVVNIIPVSDVLQVTKTRQEVILPA
jgi:hypothetical protein